MTETQNVATYARIRPYNPAINEDKRLTARAQQGTKILNQNGDREDTYNFTQVFDMTDSTNDLFERGMKPLLDYKILQGITSIFIVYGQSGSGKSFTLIGEEGHLGVLPMSLQYLLKQDNVERIDISSIECYGIKAAKIGFYDLVCQLKIKQKIGKKYDAYSTKDNSRLNPSNAEMLEITNSNCLKIITELQEVSHMAPTLKNPHSSRGHTVYFSKVKMTGLEDVYFIAIDLAGSEGQTALGTKDEFVNGLKLAMSKGKLKLSKKQMNGIEQMYKTRSLEAGCINNGLTQLQSIFGELIRKKISKSQGLGLRKVLSSFISLNSAYAILFTLSASANNNKVTRATLNFAKQTQLVKVDTKKAAVKIDKDAIIKELNALIEELRKEMGDKNATIQDLKKQLTQNKQVINNDNNDGDDNKEVTDDIKVDTDNIDDNRLCVFSKFDELTKQISAAEIEEAKWTVNEEDVSLGNMNEDQLKKVFDQFDEDGGGTIDGDEFQKALQSLGLNKNMDEVNELIQEIDANGDGEVDFDEFKVMAGKSWFIDAYQSKLIKSMERMMTTMNILGDDYDDDDDDEKLMKNDNDKELMKNIKQKDQRIEELQKEIENIKKQQMEKTTFYEKQNEEKQNTLNIMNELRNKMDILQNENDRLKKEELLKEENERKQMEEIGELQNEIKHLKNEQLKTENDKLKNDMNILENEKDELRDKLKLQQLQNENDLLKNENKSLRDNIDRLQNENDINIIDENDENKELRDNKQEQNKNDYIMGGLQNDDMGITEVPSSTGCDCFLSFFKKFKKNDSKPLTSDTGNSSPWNVQKLTD